MFLQCVHECTCVCKITNVFRVGPSYRYSVPSMFDYCYFSYLNRRKISKLECFSISPSAGLSLPHGGGHLHRSPQPCFPAELHWSPEETVVQLRLVEFPRRETPALGISEQRCPGGHRRLTGRTSVGGVPPSSQRMLPVTNGSRTVEILQECK